MTAGCAVFGLVSAMGQQWVTNPLGNNWLAPNPGFPIVNNATVGTAASGNATLRVRGDQLPVNGQWPAYGGAPTLCTFRTDVSVENQNWSMVRGALEMGRLWHTARRTVENYFWRCAE